MLKVCAKTVTTPEAEKSLPIDVLMWIEQTTRMVYAKIVT